MKTIFELFEEHTHNQTNGLLLIKSLKSSETYTVLGVSFISGNANLLHEDGNISANIMVPIWELA